MLRSSYSLEEKKRVNLEGSLSLLNVLVSIFSTTELKKIFHGPRKFVSKDPRSKAKCYITKMLWDSVYFDFIVDEFDALHRYLNSSSTRELKKKSVLNKQCAKSRRSHTIYSKPFTTGMSSKSASCPSGE